jgi:hypothetical protein
MKAVARHGVSIALAWEIDPAIRPHHAEGIVLSTVADA